MTWNSLIGGRYQPIRLAGAGAYAEVMFGLDTATGEPVALKRSRLPHGDPDGARRREVAALRALKVPGVVRLRDVHIEGRTEVLVMDWVEGAPFPGAPGPMPWERLRPLALALLDTVRGVHALGLRHNDLKPDNVLVDLSTGRVTVLDFNLAAERPDDPGGGTLLTMAPEVIRGEPSTAASDLYSVGIVVAYGLFGDWPPNEALAQALSGQPATALRLEGVDAEAAAWIEGLTQPDPALRRAPALADAPLDAALGALQARVGALKELFTGPELVHHLPSDAARALLEVAGPDPAAQREALARWIRRGEAVLRPEGVELLPRALEEVAAPPALRDALLRGDAAEIVRLAEADAWDLARSGRLGEACGRLRLAVAWGPEEPGISPAVEALAVYSFAQEQPLPLRDARRAIDGLGGVSAVARLLEAYQSVLEGDLRYAEGLARSLAPFESDVLEIWRVATLVLIGKRQGEGEARLHELGPCLTTRGPVAQSKLQRWWSHEHYVAGRFEEATAALVGAADAEGLRPDERVAASIQLATATLETGRLDDAERIAEGARALAEAARLPLYEARALWTREAAAARAGRRAGPDLPLLAAFDHLNVVDIAAWLRLTYAGAALRGRRLDEGLQLARRAAAALTDKHPAEPQVLALAAIGLCGGEPFDAEALYERLQRPAVRSERIKLQALAAVVCRATGPLRGFALGELEALVTKLPDPDRCLELLSAAEALKVARRGGL
ncbi:protein kinase [Myxococcota bacterium]|nr:protein kinase [Myxococcota bacterium]